MLLLPAVCSAGEEPAMKPQKQSDANITGHVVDAKTYEHLAFATIAVKGTTIGIATDVTGHYFLKNLPQGRFTLVASSVGYRSAEQTVEISPDKTIEVNFSLTEEALSVEEVVVSASRTETNKKTSPTIVSVASAKLFESTASCNLAETMNFQSGLRVETNCGNCGTTQLRINVYYVSDGIARCGINYSSYLVLTEDGAVFQVDNNEKYEKKTYDFRIPKQYEALTDCIKEGIRFYQNNAEYRSNLSPDTRKQLKAIKEAMDDRCHRNFPIHCTEDAHKLFLQEDSNLYKIQEIYNKQTLREI